MCTSCVRQQKGQVILGVRKQENCLFNNSLITSHFIQNTDFILAQALRYYYFFLSVWPELEQAVPPLLRHLAGILDSQQDPSVRHKKLSSISCSEKLCGFADDLLSRVIQYISSSQTTLSNTFIVVKPCSAQLSKLYSRVTNKKKSYAIRGLVLPTI